ncbi:MAG TPA: FtsX-like permease family protein [Methylomirabilota bacterium]|nr:FtsX-like permease family protein [Methylomirabilota bacterium]
MKIRDLCELAGRNLRESLLRNSLTTLGIGVGVASLVAMLSLGIGLQQLAMRRLERTGLFDSVMVRPRQLGGPNGGARQRFGIEAQPQSIRPLDEDSRQQIAKLPGVLEVYSPVRFNAEVSLSGATSPAAVAPAAPPNSASQSPQGPGGPRGMMTAISGLPDSDSTNDAFDGMPGRFFSSQQAQEAILSKDLAQSLADDAKIQPAALVGHTITVRFPQRQSRPVPAADESSASSQPPASTDNPADLALGFTIVPAEKQFTIVGVIVSGQPGAGPGGFEGSGAYIPLGVAQQLDPVQGSDLREVMGEAAASRGGARYASLTVRTDGTSAVPPVEASIKQMGYQTFSLLDMTRNLQLVFKVFDMFLGIFGSLALAVASLGIINTLVMAILERRREIGVLKALGAADRDVRRLFFVEAAAMGFLGGALGVGLGWGIGRVINFGTTFYLHRQGLPSENIWSVPWWLVLAAMGFSVLVSLAAGTYPASRAARLDPVEALRYE